MILAISAFVLALLAFGTAVAALIISVPLRRGMDSLQSQTEKRLLEHVGTLQLLSGNVSERLRELERATPTRVAAEVAALADAVDKLTAQHRKLHGYVHATKPGAPGDRERQGDFIDDELASMLALQNAKPAPPVN